MVTEVDVLKEDDYSKLQSLIFGGGRRYDVDAVFGTEIAYPLSYVWRSLVDQKFSDDFNDGWAPILIFGPRRSGKTCLYTRQLQALGTDYIQIPASAEVTTESIPQLISAELRASERDDTTAKLPKEIAVHLNRVFHKKPTIVIDDFHNVAPGERERIARFLRTLVDNKVKVVIVAAWRAVQIGLDSDLGARLRVVDAGQWEQDDIRRMLIRGGAHLNVRFDDSCSQMISSVSKMSIVTAQYIARNIAVALNNVTETQAKSFTLSCTPDLIGALARTFFSNASGGYWSALYRLATYKAEGTEKQYASIVELIINQGVDKLASGISFDEVHQSLASFRAPRKGLTKSLGDRTATSRNLRNLRDYGDAAAQEAIGLEWNADLSPSVRVADPNFLAWLNFTNEDAQQKDRKKREVDSWFLVTKGKG